MVSSPAPSLCPAPSAQPSRKPSRNPRSVRKQGRPAKRTIAGWVNWYNRLTRAGRLEEAASWYARVKLSSYGVPPPAPAPEPAAPSPANPLAPSSGFASNGGAGVATADWRGNWDKTTQNGQNLQYGCEITQQLQNSQCSPLATAEVVPLAVEADLTRLAAKAGDTPTVTPPTGESEGERGFGQAQIISGADNAGVREEVVSVWPKVGEGIVGKLCRNKQYNELRVVGEGGREMWTKVGNWKYRTGLVRGERVLVRKVWGSGDDTDAEYEVVRRLDVNEAAEEVPVLPVVEESVPPIEDVVVETPPLAVSKQETTAGVLPQFQREEPDFPRRQESAQDYISRIRAEAALWANGQGR
jgi:hypothetical protein